LIKLAVAKTVFEHFLPGIYLNFELLKLNSYLLECYFEWKQRKIMWHSKN